MSTGALIAEGLLELGKVLLPMLIEKHAGDVKAALAELGDEYESRRTAVMPDISGDVAADRAKVDAFLDARDKSDEGGGP